MASEIVRNLRKDIQVEARSRTALNLTLAFSVTVTLALSLASGGVRMSPGTLSILLWIVLFFSAMNGLSHIFVREEERRTETFLRLYSSYEAIYLSKLLFNVAFMCIIETAILPLFVFFLQIDVIHRAHFIAAAAAGGLAISSAATILAAMVARAGGRGSLFTVISFPVMMPVIWVAINATALSLDPKAHPSWNPCLFLLAFSGFIVAMSFLLFRFVWLDE